MNKPANDTQPTQQRRLHPLVAGAAAAVIIASLAATAAVTGLFSKASGTGAQTDQTQAARVTTQPGVVDSAAPVNGSARQQQLAEQQAQQQPPQPAAQPAPAAPALQQQYAQQQQAQAAPQYAQQPPPQSTYCSTCGTVVAISAVRQEGHGTGIGAVGGAVAGGVVGNQFGSGGGRTAMTLLGALGGGLAGNSVEKHIRTSTSYSVRVRMENGKTRYFTYHEAPPFQQGQHVRVENGTLVAG
ncbi:glycine zipper 2TM domain-containing protein [Paraburkholderia ginsengisoli]|uniref:Glycine zipper 2TM domain-containing protein n=1 Tax=Paraburkholderia ginsengisoli TaxID=311231 RepID=A0A7T4N2V6_9BURK|nr:glycine zipper 2TM domain-containing protein [Paraburkholderia ginsengisoli]QQC64236.1 glycine zipper 2TM domain-containing protein [Paraburkholderia ginsengisoli]